MPRQSSTVIENNFTKGLITEATGLQYPEHSVVETFDCIFDVLGGVQRRKGFDYEYGYSSKIINKASVAIYTYLWKNVTGDGQLNYLVVQVGSLLYFYSASDGAIALSGNAVSQTIDLTTFLASGAPTPGQFECQMSDGLNKLFVVHPCLNNFYIKYGSGVFTAYPYTLQIRDLEGVDDDYAVDFRPTTLTANDNHRYNLYNQGWDDAKIQAFYNATQAPSNVPVAVSSTQGGSIAAGTYYLVQTFVDATGGETYAGLGTSVTTTGSTGTIVVSAPLDGGPMATGWRLYIGTSTLNLQPLTMARTQDYILKTVATGTGTSPTSDTITRRYPSNADQWWLFKNIDDIYDPATAGLNSLGTAQAPKGHYIMDLYTGSRDTVSGLSGILSTPAGSARTSVTAFFAGRVWHGGVNATGFVDKLYFSRILTSDKEVGQAYQNADPTAEDVFAIQPDDGGVISIPEMGTVYKMVVVANNLLIFAYRGIWLIAGSTGLGFTATDYVVSRLSTVRSVSGTSFVDLNGLPVFWNTDGIWGVQYNKDGSGLQVNSLSLNTIQSFYDEIPTASKNYARGVFNPLTQIVTWLYKSVPGDTLEDQYEFDACLNFNIVTGAFYPWTISTGATVHGLVVLDGTGGITQETTAIDDAGDTVVDDVGDIIVGYDLTNKSVAPKTKYLTSFPSGTSTAFTFSETIDESFTDWVTFGAKVNYSSYFITGYKLFGQTNRDFQSQYCTVYNEGTGVLYIQGVWDFSVQSSNGRMSTKQLCRFEDTTVSNQFRRVKIRGHGKSLQYKVSSLGSNDFNVIGWSTWVTINSAM